MIERKQKNFAKIAVYAVIHEIYFEQFEGLRESLNTYHHDLIEKISKNDVEVVDFGIIGNNTAAFETANRINAEGVDLIMCNMITYATSSVFAPILQNCTAPHILIALQPRRAMDYKIANTFMQLENDNICAVPEFMCAAERFGKKIHDCIIGTLYNDKQADKEIAAWCSIANVLHSLKGARLGLMGHTMEAMYDMHADPTAIASAFGVHVPLLEIDDIVSVYNDVSENEIQDKVKQIDQIFDMPDPQSDPLTEKLTEKDKYRAAKTAVALDKFVEKYHLTGLAYYYEGLEGSVQREIASTFIVGNSILNAQGIPMCGEFDIKTLIAMLIMDRLGIGGSFAEFHPFDFEEDFILVGHDGPHHIAIANGKPILRSLKKYHGKPGNGASVEFKIKDGPITMLGITQKYDGKFKFVVGEGTSKSGPIPPTGNTNTRGFFAPTTKEFVKKWVMQAPTHHFALGVGHHGELIAKIAAILGIECIFVNGG